MSYIPPYFERGKPIEASKLNTMIDLLRQAIVQPGRGYSVTRNWGGTSLSIIDKSTATGTASTLCPFQVSNASEGTSLKVNVQWGIIAGMIPTGMNPQDDPQLVLNIESSCFIYAMITYDLDTLLPNSVSFSVEDAIVENTPDTQYWLVASVVVEDSVITKILNVCQQPYASPCSLATAPPAP